MIPLRALAKGTLLVIPGWRRKWLAAAIVRALPLWLVLKVEATGAEPVVGYCALFPRVVTQGGRRIPLPTDRRHSRRGPDTNPGRGNPHEPDPHESSPR